MSKAAELAALIGSQTAQSNRNLVINGAMQVAQRGTSFATMGNGDSQYTLDRFRWQESGSTTAEMTVTQSSTSPSEFSKSLKVDVTTADTTLGASDLIYIQYRNEGNVLGGIAKGTSDAKPLTLSFYVRSNTTGTFVVYLFDADNTRSVSGTYTINAANTWERKEVNFPADTSGALTIDNSHAMSINWILGAGSDLKSSTLQTSWGSYDTTALATGSTDITGSTSNDWYITGVQLEVGDVATAFEHRSFGDELARCQRYFERSYSIGTATGTATASGAKMFQMASASTVLYPSQQNFITVKRAAPTMVAYSTSDGLVDRIRDASAAENKTVSSITNTSTASTGNVNISSNSTSGRQYLYQWTADAEL